MTDRFRERSSAGDDDYIPEWLARLKVWAKRMKYIGPALLVLFTILGGAFTLDETERGVVLRNGAFSRIAQPGLNFKWPYIESVAVLSLQSHIITFKDMEAYSADQQPATIRLSVNYRLDVSRIEEVYNRYQTIANVVARVVDPNSYKEAKVVFGRFTASRAITDRQALNIEIKRAISEAVTGEPVIVENAQVEDIKFSATYEKSVEERMLAEVAVQKMKQNLDQEKVQAEITVTKAKAEADATMARATASANAIKVTGEAEASAIKARAAALGDNPHIVALTQAEKWDGKLPQTMLPNSALPIIKRD